MGRGCSRLVIDDPHGANDMYSKSERTSTVKFVRGSLFSRLDNPAKAIVIAHARVHEDDITGVLLKPDHGDDTPRPKIEEPHYWHPPESNAAAPRHLAFGPGGSHIRKDQTLLLLSQQPTSLSGERCNCRCAK